RSGRQGDPGISRFYLSLEDDLFRLFASERLIDFLKKSGREGETIEHPMLTKAISRAQQRVEQYNYDIRKRLLEYDDVVNKQREVIYSRRLEALTGEGLHQDILETIEAVADYQIRESIPDDSEEEDWNLSRARVQIAELCGAMIPLDGLRDSTDEATILRGMIAERVLAFYAEKERRIGQDLLRELEKWAVLRAIDVKWRDHLYEMDHLRAGIGLRSYGQRDPLVEYKKEAFSMFESLLDELDRLSVRQVLSLWPQPSALKRAAQPVRAYQPALAGPGRPDQPQPVAGEGRAPSKPQPMKRDGPRVGRNDPCPCGSGKKYKKCCGA
ncbi:SEC-C domain-containing protein, partial [Candidatus Fermentibacterales bacterium]|nr:SEC-C domain-containing protein [Candidatus Fermentibacterales bacterium]